MRSPVTRMVEEYNALSEVEQKVFLDLVDPQPEPPAKQTRKKRGKSARAESLSNVIAKTPKVDGDALCVAQVPTLGVPCGERADALIHDPTAGYAAYHPFVPAAPAVAKRSSRKGAGTSTTASTEGETGNATAVGASGD